MAEDAERCNDVPFRALNTMSSGLGTSNANPRRGGRGLGGRKGKSRPKERRELADLLLADRSFCSRMRASRSALWCWQRYVLSEPLADAPSGTGGSSLTSRAANAEGDARERMVPAENMCTS